MKKILILAMLLTIFQVSHAQKKKYTTIEEAAEAFRLALVQADMNALTQLTADSLSYGHSSAKIQDKTAFLKALKSGQSDFVTIDITEQQVSRYGNTTVMRHQLYATTNDAGNPGTVKLHILLVWKKINGSWKLIARQAVKPPIQ